MIIVNNAKEDLTYRAHGLVLELKPGVNIIDVVEFTANEIKNHFGQYVNVIVDRDGTVIKEDKKEDKTSEGTKDEETGDETVIEDGDETGEGTKEGTETEGTGEETEGGENEGTGETEGTGEETKDETTVEVAEKCKPCYEDGKTPSEDDCKACKEKEEAEAKKAEEKKETKKQDKPKRGSGKKNK